MAVGLFVYPVNGLLRRSIIKKFASYLDYQSNLLQNFIKISAAVYPLKPFRKSYFHIFILLMISCRSLVTITHSALHKILSSTPNRKIQTQRYLTHITFRSFDLYSINRLHPTSHAWDNLRRLQATIALSQLAYECLSTVTVLYNKYY